MISYKPLEHTLIDKGITKSKMREDLHISKATSSKFAKREYVSLETIEKICLYLQCPIENVVEIKP